MVEATSIIAQARIRVEGLRLAKNAVKDDIRAKGHRLKDYEAKDITKLAELLFSEHRAELIGQATIGLLFARGSVRTAATKLTNPRSFHDDRACAEDRKPNTEAIAERGLSAKGVSDRS
jgi:hypothetical protein